MAADSALQTEVTEAHCCGGAHNLHLACLRAVLTDMLLKSVF